MEKLGSRHFAAAFLRGEISKRCRGLKVDWDTPVISGPQPLVPAQPFCADHSDVTPKTCAWACLHFSSFIGSKWLNGSYTNTLRGSMAWPCPGEAKCIERNQLCDGVQHCSNGQDEDKNLCTEDFCKNGFVSYDGNHLNYTKSPEEYETDLSNMRFDHIFSDRSDYYNLSLNNTCKT